MSRSPFLRAHFSRAAGCAAGDGASGQRLVDSWTHSGRGQDEGVTWHDYEEKKGPALRLDYGFVSPDLASKIRGARIDQDAPGSDHQPYWFELDL